MRKCRLKILGQFVVVLAKNMAAIQVFCDLFKDLSLLYSSNVTVMSEWRTEKTVRSNGS